jgi:hypothetical protein
MGQLDRPGRGVGQHPGTPFDGDAPNGRPRKPYAAGFEDRLTQSWWVTYREAKDGDIWYRETRSRPLMQHEDLIVKKTEPRGEQ